MSGASARAGVLFDLDGTLADTAPDLAAALNATRRAAGHPPLPLAQIRPHVSHGAAALIRLGFGLTPEDSAYPPIRDHLLTHYRDHIAEQTRLFPGITDLLDTLVAQALPWGIVTNKPGWLTTPLVAALPLPHPPATVVSGDTLAQSKPAPEPLWHACREAGCAPERTLYIGDAARDIEAGKRAGMVTLAARYGYVEPADAIEQWGADAIIDQVAAIHAWLPRL